MSTSRSSVGEKRMVHENKKHTQNFPIFLEKSTQKTFETNLKQNSSPSTKKNILKHNVEKPRKHLFMKTTLKNYTNLNIYCGEISKKKKKHNTKDFLSITFRFF